jgi:alpha-galactosidase/6-phospho-beta-glucosidase family protein
MEELGVSATIETETDPDTALKEADFVIITISTGGLDAMDHDLQIPEEYGIYQTVGDTVGPGGWARALRNIPVFTDLAQRINHLAPRAVILNYTNPMAQLTKALCLSTSRPVVGLCHGLFENLRFLQEIFHPESEEEIACVYGGINHFFWITSFSVRGEDGYKLLGEKTDEKSLPELLAEMHPGRVDSYLADELFRLTGLLTYARDRHTSEFFPQYLTSEKNMEKYHLKRTTVQERREGMRRREQEIERMTEGEIPDPYRRRSRETAADIIHALVTGNEFIDVGNAPNVGQVANLPMGSVLETPVLVTPSGFRPITVGCLPEPVRTWVERHIRVQDLTVEAAKEGDLDQAFKALALDPLVSHLNLQEVEDMGMRLLKANAPYLPQFFG